MKSIFIYCGILLALCIFVLVEGDCEWYGEIYSVGEHYINCTKHTCTESGDWNILLCPLFTCNEIIGYNEMDLNKPYPECCESPICKDSENNVTLTW